MPSQLTPYTCVLDSFSYYLRELGINVYSTDILTNHRDICFNAPPQHATYGAIDINRFRILIARYLLKSTIIENPNIEQLKGILINKEQAIFVISNNYNNEGTNHAFRLIGFNEANEPQILVTLFPYGNGAAADIGTLTNVWVSTYIHVYF